MRRRIRRISRPKTCQVGALEGHGAGARRVQHRHRPADRRLAEPDSPTRPSRRARCRSSPPRPRGTRSLPPHQCRRGNACSEFSHREQRLGLTGLIARLLAPAAGRSYQAAARCPARCPPPAPAAAPRAAARRGVGVAGREGIARRRMTHVGRAALDLAQALPPGPAAAEIRQGAQEPSV